MRIGILSDCQLGERRFRKRADAVNNMFKVLNHKAFEEAIDIFLQEDVEAVLLAGDFFDQPNPDVEAILQSKKLARLGDIQTHIIGGNHENGPMNTFNGQHPFDLIALHNVHTYLNPEYVEIGQNLGVIMLPYGCNNPDGWKFVHEISCGNNAKNRLLVLLCHGYVDISKSADPDDPYAIPKSVAENVDLVAAGHIHLPHASKNVVEKGKTVLLTPGALSPSAAALSVEHPESFKPSVWILDVDETKSQANLVRHELESAIEVHVEHVLDINQAMSEKVLSSHENGIWHLAWPGSVSDINMELYKKVLTHALNVTLQPAQESTPEILVGDAKVAGFWDWISNEHAEWFDDFKKMIGGNEND